jgi:carbon monoxide dehydrogenase subunit G
MDLTNSFEVRQPVETVWDFLGNVPAVASCLPGAEMTEELGDDTYGGRVGVRMGPVRLQFAGRARITSRDEAARRMVIDASGADEKGRGQANLGLVATLSATRSGTTVRLDQDLQLSGAAAQYGRGMISDVTSVLMGQFADNMQRQIDAMARGERLDVSRAAAPAGGLSIALQAVRLALGRVFRRFFLPYEPTRV